MPQYQIDNWTVFVTQREVLKVAVTTEEVTSQKVETLKRLLQFCTHSPKGKPVELRQSLLAKPEVCESHRGFNFGSVLTFGADVGLDSELV